MQAIFMLAVLGVLHFFQLLADFTYAEKPVR